MFTITIVKQEARNGTHLLSGTKTKKTLTIRTLRRQEWKSLVNPQHSNQCRVINHLVKNLKIMAGWRSMNRIPIKLLKQKKELALFFISMRNKKHGIPL